ncbi:MAG TPA: carbohydrate kinase family protein, partial [Paenibacillus sp.]|nr:carbohydrate kinase family protein [Paenibacillus sp.]
MINLVGILTADLILAQVKERPDFGEEHMVDHMIMRPGALANTMFPLAKLGVKLNVFSQLGTDEFGEKIHEELAPLIENALLRTETPTVLSVSVVKDDGARYFVTYSGNAYEFTKEVVDELPAYGEAKAMLLYGYFLAPKFGPEGAIACLRQAKADGQLTFFDANSAIDGWSEKSREEIYSFLPYIDYFMPNDEELLKLTGLASEEDAVAELFRRGAAVVVVKQGARGATAFTRDGRVSHPGFPVVAYDTTGAGDSFNAGF